MSPFLSEPLSTEKSCTVPFNEISQCSSFVKSFDTLPKQNLYQNMLVILCFKFVNLCLIYVQVTLITIVMQT